MGDPPWEGTAVAAVTAAFSSPSRRADKIDTTLKKKVFPIEKKAPKYNMCAYRVKYCSFCVFYLLELLDLFQ